MRLVPHRDIRSSVGAANLTQQVLLPLGAPLWTVNLGEPFYLPLGDGVGLPKQGGPQTTLVYELPRSQWSTG